MDAVLLNHCPVVRDEIVRQGLRRIPSAGKGHNVEGGSPPTSHDASILDGNFSALQHEAFQLTLNLPKDPRKCKTVQLMQTTEKLWKSPKYKEKARMAMKKLPNALQAIIAAEGGPTGR